MPLVLFDLDGVLADFAGGVAKLFGAAAPGPEHAGKDLATALGVSAAGIWQRIDAQGRRFWEELEATAEAEALVALARERGEIAIASSPSQDPASAAGKLRWIQQRFGRRCRDFVLTPRKDLLAAPGRLLVDDSPEHVAAFRAAGGTALLHPTWANGGRPSSEPVAALRAALDELG
jgi:phosphoglycolate phosphatase-like HAD superfamily hydrolase